VKKIKAGNLFYEGCSDTVALRSATSGDGLGIDGSLNLTEGDFHGGC